MADVLLGEKKKKVKKAKEGLKKKKKVKKTTSKEQLNPTKSELNNVPPQDEVYNPETIRWLNRLSDDELETERIRVYKEKRRERYRNS